jgi:peptide/nickel transport system substrate-binding protein
VKFHDGEPFDAAAAKFSLERHLNSEGLVPQAELGASKPSTWSIP